MSNCPENNPLKREGLSQFQRALAALKPDYVHLDERTIEDMLKLAVAYATDAKPILESTTISDDWKTLFDYAKNFHNSEDNKQIQAEMEQRHDFSPHFALFLCFLKLFEFLQKDINQITKRHLDFYYKDVLKLSNKAPIADSVHILFTLAKNISETIVNQETPLDAGRDESKPSPRPLTYFTKDNLAVNAAKIAHLRSVFITPGNIFFAPNAKTADGIEKPLPKENPSWNAFGPKPKATASCDNCDGTINKDIIALPTAQVGFAVASNILHLAEGERKITLDITTTQSFPAGIKFNIELSGSKGWIEAKEVKTTISGTNLKLTCTIVATEKDQIVAFDATKLDGNYQITSPIMRCWLADAGQYQSLKNVQITTIKINVDVKGLKKTLVLENDLGRISSEKPSMPFGSQPVEGSTLHVGCQEAQQKTLASLTVRFGEWIGQPTNFVDYNLYSPTNPAPAPIPTVAIDKFKANVEIINGNLKSQNAINQSLFPNFQTSISSTSSSTNLLIGGYRYYSGMYFGTGNLIKSLDSSNLSIGTFTAAPPKTVSDSLLKIKLNSPDFGHNIFSRVLTGLVTYNAIHNASNPIPDSPYTPEISALTLDYVANTKSNTLTNATFEEFSSRDIQFFHLGIFGYSEEHCFLKKDLLFLDNNAQSITQLLPQYAAEGTFYVGLQDIEPLQAISILFQMSEGSANPLRTVAEVKWSVLSKNAWRLLNEENILQDTTNQLLTSGIIKFYFPQETTLNNTFLESGLVWLKAELKNNALSAPIDSVCNIIDLHPQAVLATFHDDKNELKHYDQPLAAQTISKAREGLAAIKKIEQPYASFGNKPQETDEAFYRKVSERLRHKQRAYSIWDYEHLILQQYPNIFKIKCLNHSKFDKSLPKTNAARLDQLAPGYVTVVLVPDLRNQNAVNKLEPKVDLNTLQVVGEYLQKHAGKLVSIATTNPDYEPVRLKFKVKFKQGFPFATYKKALNSSIIAYLSPWVADASVDVPFGGMLEKSVIINFIERLNYVDVLRDFVMLRNGDNYEGYEEITASNPMAVLVSCEQHCIIEFSDC